MWWQWWKHHAFRVRTTEYKCDSSHQLENPGKVTCGVRVLQNSSLRGNQWGFSKHNPFTQCLRHGACLLNENGPSLVLNLVDSLVNLITGCSLHTYVPILKFHRRGWPTQLELPLCQQTMVWILSSNWNNVARRLRNYILPRSLKGRSFPRPGR